MRVDVYHHIVLPGATPDSGVAPRLDLIQQALVGVVNHLGNLGEFMESAVERLSREGQETAEVATQVLSAFTALEGRIGKLSDDVARLSDQLRANSDNDSAVKAVADQLDAVQTSLRAAVADALAVTNPPAEAGNEASSGTGEPAPATDTSGGTTESTDSGAPATDEPTGP